MNKQYVILLAVAMVIIFNGCSTDSVRVASPGQVSASGGIEQQVEQRAKARWEKLLAEDWFAAYDYTTPAFKETTPIDVYSVHLRTTNVRWNSADYKGVSCESENICTAIFFVKYMVNEPSRGVQSVPGQTTIDEQWLYIDDQWYHVEE